MIDLTLSDAEKARITEAVTAAEAQTSGEIVTIIAPSSSTYADIAQDWAIFIAFLAFAVFVTLTPFYLNLLAQVLGWFGIYAAELSTRSLLMLLFVAVFLKYLGTLLILQWRRLRLWLTPRAVKRQRVRTAALTIFKVTTQANTAGRTGVLLYLSEAENMAEIIADEAIHAALPESIWLDAMVALVADVKHGRVADGMVAAVAQIGTVLAAQFPRAPGDVNELPDRVTTL